MVLIEKKALFENDKASYRLALELRLINAMIRCSNYPLPRLDITINKISQYRSYTTLDFPSVYH